MLMKKNSMIMAFRFEVFQRNFKKISSEDWLPDEKNTIFATYYVFEKNN